MEAIGIFLFFVSMCGSAAFTGGGPAGEELVFRGASDASAAVAIGEDLIIVADDENNVLRVYRAGQGGMPVSSFDLTGYLAVDPKHPEADIEGATMVGNRIYWITSHGRNKDGKMRPSRYRFFATDVSLEGGKVIFQPVGAPCTTLVHGLLRTPHAGRLGLDEASRLGADLAKKEREKLAPKEEGLNIEGLCASADGKTVYIGFRNPKLRPGSRAIVVPLYNAAGVVERGEAPAFKRPMLWDLGGLGIRSMEYWRFAGAYVIIAGSSDEDGVFGLYLWSGGSRTAPRLLNKLSPRFTPEALIPFADGRLLLLSDDGSLPIKVSGPADCLEGEYRNDGTCLNKHLADPEKKTFRGMWLMDLRRR